MNLAVYFRTNNIRFTPVVVDTAAVAREHIANAGLSQRLRAIGGDLITEDFGAGCRWMPTRC